MTVLTIESDEKEDIVAKVYTRGNDDDPAIVVHSHHEPRRTVCVLMCDLTESNLRQLKGYDDGISTSAVTYGVIEEAVYSLPQYRDRIPYQK